MANCILEMHPLHNSLMTINGCRYINLMYVFLIVTSLHLVFNATLNIPSETQTGNSCENVEREGVEQVSRASGRLACHSGEPQGRQRRRTNVERLPHLHQAVQIPYFILPSRPLLLENGILIASRDSLRLQDPRHSFKGGKDEAWAGI
ncbi:hypothetical protein P7K49_029992 [Saguinus oedipus]|uniref:Uncharacterized protein n=1 Tax=Saguinus oedipus TaxID=9490 RepID=A0ABQ9U8T2_SAGOE|nr:hypothetical protein P7K49_029992 [Saguinus oedipus]